jgi:predicted tellurium resistance membrane protein TerC
MTLTEIFSQPSTWASLATLTAMEIVLGLDNIVFISILTGKLPPAQQPLARRLGLGLALGSRLALLFAISWVMGLTEPFATILGKAISGRDLILVFGGLFLIAKATWEIYDKLEVDHADADKKSSASAFGLILVQIIFLDIVFSLDSVITAVGMAQHVSIMVVAMVIAVAVMVIFAQSVGDFVNRHPSMKILALSFLLLIGVMLMAEGMGQHVGKGYIYFAMAFSLAIELLNMRLRKKSKPLALHHRFEEQPGSTAQTAATSSP